MKPDWKDAPEWAGYLAQDGEGGGWFWFAAEPIWDSCIEEWCPSDSDARHQQAVIPRPRGTLERRP